MTITAEANSNLIHHDLMIHSSDSLLGLALATVSHMMKLSNAEKVKEHGLL